MRLPLLRTISLRVLLWWAMNVESEREHTKHIPSYLSYISIICEKFSTLSRWLNVHVPQPFFLSGYSFHHPILRREQAGFFCDINFINLSRSSIHPRAVKSGSSGFNEGEIGEEHAARGKKRVKMLPSSAYWFFNLYTLWSEKKSHVSWNIYLMTRRRSSSRYATHKLCKFGSSMSILFFIEDIEINNY